MKRNYKIILFVYIAMQLLMGMGVQLTSLIFRRLGLSGEQLLTLSYSFWLIISFLITLAITLYQLRDEIQVRNKNALPLGKSLLWAVGGLVLVMFVQALAIQFESFLGVDTGSENTENILSMVKKAPLFILIISVIGPILEEIVFRKIIFGTLFRKYGFFLSAVISSVIFALAHLEPEHMLLYTAIGFVFAFLYLETKRITVPIFTHMLMNTLVVITHLVL